MSLKQLRGVLGNRVRIAIDVSDRDTSGILVECVLAARWRCGCRASGPSFRALRCVVCDEHREHAPAA